MNTVVNKGLQSDTCNTTLIVLLQWNLKRVKGFSQKGRRFQQFTQILFCVTIIPFNHTHSSNLKRV